MSQQEIIEYNRRCAEFLGWQLFKAKSASYWEDGTFYEWDEPDEVYVEEPTEEFKKHLILSNPEEVGLSYDFKLFKDYHWASNLKFHLDWNLIMEVVEAIEKKDYKFQLGWNITALISLVPKTPTKIALIETENRKEAVVQAINQFLIWYNENKISTVV